MSTVLERVKLATLRPDPDQPRKYFDPVALQELADDIAANDVIEPIVYFIGDDNKKTILAGERRWRAAALAGLKTVPCIKRDAPDPMARLFVQVSENFQREGLNAIELAMFFEQLVTTHGVKAGVLGQVLEKHGLKKFERSYISNIRRLLKLAPWAQDMIQQGRLSASHGKYLLPMMASETVQADMRAFLGKHDAPTVDDIEEAIDEAFHEHHIYVNRGRHSFDSHRYIPTEFDYQKECKGCTTCYKVNIHSGYSGIFCLNELCYDEKQAAAVEKNRAAVERRKKTDETRRRKALEKQAKANGCNDVEEFIATQAVMSATLDDPRAAGRRERTQVYLDDRLRPQINAHLLEDEATRYQLVLYMAAGAPNDHGYTGSYRGCYASVDIDEHCDGIDLTLQNKIGTTQLELMTCSAGIDTMSRENLRALAHHCGIRLDDFYTVDSEYLDIKNKAEIIAITPERVRNSYDDGEWEKLCKGPAGKLKDRLLARDHLFGVPADLQAMYNNATDDDAATDDIEDDDDPATENQLALPTEPKQIAEACNA